MSKNDSTVNTKKIIAVSSATKKRIAAIAEEIKGKELFPEKIRLAKQTLRSLKSLPI